MPDPEERYLEQDAVLWPALGRDRYDRILVGPPVQVDVRWNDVRQERRQPDGSTILIVAKVVIAMDVLVGSRMWLGTLDDWYGVGSAGADDGLCYVHTFNDTKDLKGRAVFRTLDLMRYKDLNV